MNVKTRAKMNTKKNIRENITQTLIEIGGVPIIKIQEDDKIYFPLSQIDQKLLLRQKGSAMNKSNPEKIKTFEVDFGLITGYYNKQESNCIEIGELRFILEHKTQVVRLKDEQIMSQNKLHAYLGIKELPVMIYDIDTYDFNSARKYNAHTKELIEIIIKENLNTEGRICHRCKNQYPLHSTFFYLEESAYKGYSRVCIKCKQGSDTYVFKSQDETINMLIRNNVSQDYIINYKHSPAETLCELYVKGEIPNLYKEYKTRENLFKMLDILFKQGNLNEKNLTARFIRTKYRIGIEEYEGATITDVYRKYYGDDFYLEKWKYPKYIFKEIQLTPDIAKNIFTNYIKAYDIAIDDPINFDYQSVIDKCHLNSIDKILGGITGFFVYYWEGKYAGYQFRRIGNYYRISRDNVLSDLRFLVEKDLKLKEEKIPLYVTKNFMLKHCNCLYNYLKRNGHNYYDWFNEIYPNRFDPTDFEITKYRNNFDSIEEEQVDGVLREYFDSVIYNYNNSDQVITLKNKRPDWFIMREDGVWLVEYFGMYLEKQMKNDIIRSYIDGVHEKLKAYEELEGYNFLFVYPSDIEKGFLGLRVKIDEIINKVDRIGA